MLVLLALFLLAAFGAYSLFTMSRTVPKDCFMVVGPHVYGPGQTYIRWWWDTAEEQMWQIEARPFAIETQVGNFILAWKPYPHRLAGFVHTGADDGVKAKLTELLERNAEIIRDDVLRIEGRLEGTPKGLLKTFGDDLGVEFTSVHVPEHHPDSAYVESRIEDELETTVKRFSTLIKAGMRREELYKLFGDQISQLDEARVKRGQRTMTEDIEQMFGTLEGVILTGGKRESPLPKEVPDGLLDRPAPKRTQ